MYEELVQRLRADADYMDNNGIMLYAAAPFYRECADAIEELQEDNAALNGTASNLIEQIAELSKPHWIPVTERLPEKHQWCLVVGENLYDMDFINSRGVWTIHDKPYAPIDYWMPLPEPPKEET